MRPYIGDGYDQTFYFAGVPGLYPNCKISGRVMAHHQTAGVLRETEAKPQEADAIYNKAIASRITGWAYEAEPGQWRPFDDHDGAKLEVTPAAVGGLVFDLNVRIRDVILGLKAADTDPDTGQATKTPDENEKN